MYCYATLWTLASGFSVLPPNTFHSVQRASTRLAATETDSSTTASVKQNLLSVCESLKNSNGVFIVDKEGQETLSKAVEQLEALRESRTADELKKTLVGDWTLICTTSTNTPKIDRSKIPAFLSSTLDDVRSRITSAANKYVKIQQRIKTDDASGEINRVDHVIEYSPPRSLKDLVTGNVDVPEQLSRVNLNPLEVSKSKVVLVHKATVSPNSSTLATKLALQSIVLNVAGTSAMLDPNGKDVAGLNLPVGDFINTGDFKTTYMDDTLRISRGKLGGVVEQLRVFVKQTSTGEGMRQTEMDVDEVVDSEFVYEEEDEAVDTLDEHDGQDDVSPSDY